MKKPFASISNFTRIVIAWTLNAIWGNIVVSYIYVLGIAVSSIASYFHSRLVPVWTLIPTPLLISFCVAFIYKEHQRKVDERICETPKKTNPTAAFTKLICDHYVIRWRWIYSGYKPGSSISSQIQSLHFHCKDCGAELDALDLHHMDQIQFRCNHCQTQFILASTTSFEKKRAYSSIESRAIKMLEG